MWVAASVEAPPYLAINESKASPLPAAAAVEPVEPVEVVAATAAAGEETARAAGATPVEEVTLLVERVLPVVAAAVVVVAEEVPALSISEAERVPLDKSLPINEAMAPAQEPALF